MVSLLPPAHGQAQAAPAKVHAQARNDADAAPEAGVIFSGPIGHPVFGAITRLPRSTQNSRPCSAEFFVGPLRGEGRSIPSRLNNSLIGGNNLRKRLLASTSTFVVPETS
jgi:hypothetical protein